jgi:hypothetical protein
MSTARLARLLYPSWHKERSLAVLKNLTFCGDETGIDKESKICAVTGLIGTESMWRKFDDRWNKIIKGNNIPYFHANECEGGRKTFHGLDVMKRGNIVNRLVSLIAESPLDVFGYAVVKPHFFAWNEDDRRHFTNGHPENPYYLVLGHLFICSSHHADNFDKSEKIEYVFEQQQEFEDEAKRIFGELKAGPMWPNHVRLGDIHFPESTPENLEKYPGIQAADLIAYEMNRHLGNKYFLPDLKPEWKARTVLKVLGRKLNVNHNFCYFDADQFLELSALRAAWNHETQTPGEDWVWGNAIKARDAAKANKQHGH